MNKGFIAILALAAGCVTDPDFGEDDSPAELGVVESALSEVPGCYFYVGSGYGGQALWMPRSSTIGDLHSYGMGDKISSIRLLGGATTRLWLDKYYRGSSWYITHDVWTLHTSTWGKLGDNASSADCY